VAALQALLGHFSPNEVVEICSGWDNAGLPAAVWAEVITTDKMSVLTTWNHKVLIFLCLYLFFSSRGTAIK
jgi:hypothetical protein